MKIFTLILSLIAIVLIGFNVTQIDFSAPFADKSMVAIITIIASLCALTLLQILMVSKKIQQKSKSKD
ncbi:hypothetical protein BZARG_1221 [Bizionia argentinensis JUB59]|uniref:Uncharacterized protein n=1 Tax=Bizionia argentinensis JUB59 TaxID=1046627 RepID=G2ECV2_9FLAO|nr:membrane protein [Bizionia argentinensis]EGV43784.1 hypothetical protein BZARG_1221 [Bizionia argentinensis JUB59]